MEPIPGYRLISQLGAGGYGVVWEAEAPGGLSKAVKIIYGNYADERASRELKSLNRIKEVRHPFLLSLERIEVVDGQLIIVTEMAECSLKDRFDACRAEGLAGISRDELLVYIGDTADALDHMNEHHGLQHLDIKPENLLMLGGRVKVADFGLVKEIRDVAASLMGGLTPVYAPPEVFDGRPSRFSDQYSLAIVYLEMLTGRLPFSGTTAAQLATQHLSSRPNLDGLGPHDQDVIRRALAKNPTERFATCREMVALLKQSNQTTTSSSHASTDTVTNTATATPARASRPYRSATQHAHQTAMPKLITAATVSRAGAVEPTAADQAFHPLLIVGVGGAGANVLRHLRRRICDTFGSKENAPAVELLAIDTDPKALRMLGEETPLAPEEVIATPLRRPQEYRENSGLYESVSRRWIYNIPRSGRTEGLRPLGRLALLDHADELREQIKLRLDRITEKEAVRNTAKKLGAKGATLKPRILLVGAASGGTGGGMMIDLAYLIRSCFASNEQSKFELMAMMTHATPRNAAGKDLAIVNAYAALGEISHYSRIDRQYPGEHGIGISASSDPPFDHFWFNHLGNDLSEQAFRKAAQTTSDHLFTQYFTTAVGFFANCRSEEAQPNNGLRPKNGLQARSMGVCRLAGPAGELLAKAAEELCVGLIQRWLGEANGSSNKSMVNVRETAGLLSAADQLADKQAEALTEIETGVNQSLDEFGFTYASLRESANNVIAEELAVAPNLFLGDLLEDLRSRPQNPSAEEAAWTMLEAIVGSFEEGRLTSDLASTPLGRKLEHLISRSAPIHVERISAHILALANESPLRLAAALKAGEAFKAEFKSIYDSYRQEAQSLGREIEALQKSFQPLIVPPQMAKQEAELREQQNEQMAKCFAAQLQLLAAAAVRDQLQLIGKQIEETMTRVSHLDRTLRGFRQSFRDADEANEQFDDVQKKVIAMLQAKQEELVTALDEEACQKILAPHHSLDALISHAVPVNGDFFSRVRNAARRNVVDALRGLDIASQLVDSCGEEFSERVRQSLKQATPPFDECGGKQRVLLCAKPSEGLERIRETLTTEFGEAPTVSPVRGGDAVICCEMQDIPLSQIAAVLLDGRDDYAQIADRLWGRNDVDWAPWE